MRSGIRGPDGSAWSSTWFAGDYPEGQGIIQYQESVGMKPQHTQNMPEKICQR